MTERGYETRDARIDWVLWVAAALMAMLVLCLAGVGLQLYLYHRHDPQPPLTELEREPVQAPAPNLEVDPAAGGERIEREARQRLDSYGWVDRQAGVARIPVTEAMEQMAERGWPSPREAGQ